MLIENKNRETVFVRHLELCWQKPQSFQQVVVLSAETLTCDYLIQSQNNLETWALGVLMPIVQT